MQSNHFAAVIGHITKTVFHFCNLTAALAVYNGITLKRYGEIVSVIEFLKHILSLNGSFLFSFKLCSLSSFLNLSFNLCNVFSVVFLKEEDNDKVKS